MGSPMLPPVRPGQKVARGQGVGRALMGFLARLAVQRGCVRFDWTAETDNPEALAFYDRLGAGRVAEKVYYRFDGDRLRQLAAGIDPAGDERPRG
jgi:ribosomal protein S18 acetylase RimI-like enzyme